MGAWRPSQGRSLVVAALRYNIVANCQIGILDIGNWILVVGYWSLDFNIQDAYQSREEMHDVRKIVWPA
jgi:hypothetical protein